MKRKLLFAVMLLTAVLSNTGCLVNQYASDPDIRMSQLINQSEDLRQIKGFSRRFWFNDMPSHLTPERIDGGIMK